MRNITITTAKSATYLENVGEDTEQIFLLQEFLRLLDHPGTGVERFTQMGASWKDVVLSVTNQEKLKRTSPEVEQAVACWHQELRDLSLKLSSHVGQTVAMKIERRHLADGSERLKDGIKALTEDNTLSAAFIVPDGAADIDVCADLMRRSVVFSMKLKAPQDKKTTKARLNWLLRMLKGDDQRLWVRAHWPGRRSATQKEVSLLKENPDLIDPEGSTSAPHAFEVLLIETDAKRFAGRRTFIELLEATATEFYDQVGQHLRAWQAPPPKPVRPTAVHEAEEWHDADVDQ